MFEMIGSVVQAGAGIYSDASGATAEKAKNDLELLNAQNAEADKVRAEKAKKNKQYLIGGIILFVVLVLMFKKK